MGVNYNMQREDTLFNPIVVNGPPVNEDLYYERESSLVHPQSYKDFLVLGKGTRYPCRRMVCLNPLEISYQLEHKTKFWNC